MRCLTKATNSMSHLITKREGWFSKRFIHSFALGASLLLGGLAQIHGAVMVPTDGTWTKFQWFPTTPPALPLAVLDQPFDFSIPSGASATLDITDFALTGDVFRVEDLNGNFAPFDTSPSVSLGLSPDAATPDQAFGDARWSSGSLALGPGNYSLNLSLIQQSTEVLNGGGFIRVTAAGVPEPSTAGWMLLSAGLVVFRRRRSRGIV